MDIVKFDPNLKIASSLEENDIVWNNAAKAPFRLYGAVGYTDTDAPFTRMPQAVAETVSEGVAGLNRHTAGIRVRFATDSPYIAVRIEWERFGFMGHMAAAGFCGADLYRVKDGIHSFAGAVFPDYNVDAVRDGVEGLIRVPGEMTEYVLGFPLYNDVKKLYIGVKEGCHLTAGAEEYRNKKPVVFYGSSITQGGCASRPGTCYQGFLSRSLNMDYINLGFSGNAKGEQTMADFIAGLDMAVFVYDYDHNAPNPEHLKQTHYNLYETVRRVHPDLPIVMISRPEAPGTWDVRQRLAIIADSYRRAVEAGDRNVYFINGGDFFAGEVADSCTVDGCHPTDLGFYFMAQGIEPVLRRLL